MHVLSFSFKNEMPNFLPNPQHSAILVPYETTTAGGFECIGAEHAPRDICAQVRLPKSPSAEPNLLSQNSELLSPGPQPALCHCQPIPPKHENTRSLPGEVKGPSSRSNLRQACCKLLPQARLCFIECPCGFALSRICSSFRFLV